MVERWGGIWGESDEEGMRRRRISCRGIERDGKVDVERADIRVIVSTGAYRDGRIVLGTQPKRGMMMIKIKVCLHKTLSKTDQ